MTAVSERTSSWLQTLWHDRGSILAGTVLPFVLVLYLGLAGGGYDAVLRSQVGIAVWWIVLLGAAVGILPISRVPRAAWITAGLLLAFAAWTALGITWSESSERSLLELGRVAGYAGVFTLAAATQTRESLRRTVTAVAAAVGVVAALALLSRFRPDWFPTDDAAVAFPSAGRRLSYPLNYWNGLAALMAIGMPLLLVIALQARQLWSQVLAAAAVPLLMLTAFYTLSRGGVVEIVIGTAAFLALYPRRLAALPTLFVIAAGSILLVLAATQRDALESSSATGPGATSEANEMIIMALVICAGVALLQLAIGLAGRNRLGPRVSLSRRSSLAIASAGALVLVVAALVTGVPGEVSERFEEFKSEQGPGLDDAARFESANGAGRYQLWEASLDANATAPLTGIGPGTFEFWESRQGSIPGFVRDAHSLYFEVLAELGVIGLLLIVGFVVAVAGVGATRALTRGSTDRRGWLAGALGASAAFAAAAFIDWVWELPVLPIAFMLLAAAIVGPGGEARRRERSRFAPGDRKVARPALVAVAILALFAIAIPMAGTALVRDSRSDVRAGQLGEALSDAQTAGEVQPGAASPNLQEALVLELRGELNAAASSAALATKHEPTNWRTWITLSRIEARQGHADEAIAAYRRARTLNPLSPLFD